MCSGVYYLHHFLQCGFSTYCTDVTEQSANVGFIKGYIQKKWGSEYTLVGSDGVELEDCPETEVYFPHRACILESS